VSKTFHIPLTAAHKWDGTFPDRCVSCGGPKEAESTLVASRLVARGGRQKEVALRLQVPHCRRCARATKSVFLAGCIPLVLGFVLVGAACFLLAVYGSWVLGLDEGQQAQRQPPSLVLGAAAGMFGGLVGGFAFELLARLLLIPFYGGSLLRAPMLVKQFLTDEDYVAGLKGRLNRDATRLTLEFSNEELAGEFARLNPA
jgi:hypothetical protein